MLLETIQNLWLRVLILKYKGIRVLKDNSSSNFENALMLQNGG